MKTLENRRKGLDL